MDVSSPEYIPYNENEMEIDNSDVIIVDDPPNPLSTPTVNDGTYEAIVVSSVVGLHVEGPIPFINPEIPVEQHAIVQIESNDTESLQDADRISPTLSVASSRPQSPITFTEESNQSEPRNENSQSDHTSKKRNIDCLSDDENEDDGRLCPICLDNWTNTGEHRICSLKCGHLFGYKCVNRWLESQSKKSCPTCKKRVSRGDLRYIYARKLIAIDTTELDILQKQLDHAIEEKQRILLDVSKYVCREQMLNQEIALLKKQVHELSSSRSSLHHSAHSSNHNSGVDSDIVKLYMDKSMEICRQSGCRVFDASSRLDLIVASTKSPNNLFSGYGIRKVNISQYKPLAFIPLHTLQVRDISFHPNNNWMLTASMDKSFKVVDSISNVAVYTGSHQMPLWSCCWDADNQYVLYIGTQSGSVLKYDVRRISEPVNTLSVQGDMSPVVSVSSIPSIPGGDIIRGGVISCKLNSLWMFENSGDNYVQHQLVLDGPFVSMKYQTETKQLLVSSRPNNRISHSRHTVCTLEKTAEDVIACNVTHTFQGGGMQKLLSKSCFLSHKKDYVAAHHESSKSVYLWCINNGQKVCSVPAHEAVLDLGALQNHNGNYLISLTEKKLEFFKFT